MNKTIDIRGDRSGIAGQLSNLTARPFTFHGVPCASMEGLLQAFKFERLEDQLRVCQLSGLPAKEYGMKLGRGWRRRGILYWAGQTYARENLAYQVLLRDAYRTMAQQSTQFVGALLATGTAQLTHEVGHDNLFETVITRGEFCSILTELRDEFRRLRPSRQ